MGFVVFNIGGVKIGVERVVWVIEDFVVVNVFWGCGGGGELDVVCYEMNEYFFGYGNMYYVFVVE